MRWKSFIPLTVCLLALCMVGGGIAFAQDQEDASEAEVAQAEGQAEEVSAEGAEEGPQPGDMQKKKFTDEIIVTSTRREINVRDLPGSVTVAEGFDLESMGATTLDEYINMVPGVNYIDSTPQRDSITMRGIATATYSNLNQGPVGIYVNETPVLDYFVYMANFDILPFDLERVEFLKGPQGTLYGAGSLGGTVRYLVNRPNVNRNEGALHLTVGSTTGGDGANYLAQGMFNVVLAEGKFALRGVAAYQQDGGYIKNEIPTFNHDTINGYDQQNYRVMASWTPSDKVRLDVSYMRQDTDMWAPTNSLDNDDFDNPAFGSTQWITSGDSIHEQSVFNVTLHWDLGFADLMSSTSYLEKSWNFDQQFGGLAGLDQVMFEEFILGLPPEFGGFGLDVQFGDLYSRGVVGLYYGAAPGLSETWFQEFRLVSKDTGRLDWIAGVYYANPTDFIDNWGYMPGAEDALNDVVPGAGSQLYPDDRVFAWTWSDDAVELAFYAELGIDLSDQWKLNVGGRYTDYHNDNPGKFEMYGGAMGGTAGVDEFDMQVFAPKLSINYRPSSDVMWYALASRGYRAGGVNFSYVLNNPDPDPQFTYYDTDNLWNYETGIRKTWGGGKIVTDLTAFYLDWTDIQLETQFFDPRLGWINGLFNIGEAHSVGAEFLFSAQISRGFSFNSAITYTEAVTDTDSPELGNPVTGEGQVVYAGSRLPATPNWSTSTTLQYYWDAPKAGFPFIALDHFFKDVYKHHLIVDSWAPSHSVFGLRVGTTLTNRWSLTLSVRNLFDDRTPILYFPEGDGTFLPGIFPATYDIVRPRTFALTVQKNF